MTTLSKEELDELAALERDEEKRKADEATAAKRQHLEALRMQKRLALQHGIPGLDFVVAETRVGNFAMRRPIDLEVEEIAEKADETEAQEKFLASIAIEPPGPKVQEMVGHYPGLRNVLVPAAMTMLDMARKEEAKK